MPKLLNESDIDQKIHDLELEFLSFTDAEIAELEGVGLELYIANKLEGRTATNLEYSEKGWEIYRAAHARIRAAEAAFAAEIRSRQQDKIFSTFFLDLPIEISEDCIISLEDIRTPDMFRFVNGNTFCKKIRNISLSGKPCVVGLRYDKNVGDVKFSREIPPNSSEETVAAVIASSVYLIFPTKINWDNVEKKRELAARGGAK
jgi:hypothetical protein